MSTYQIINNRDDKGRFTLDNVVKLPNGVIRAFVFRDKLRSQTIGRYLFFVFTVAVAFVAGVVVRGI